MAGVGEPDLIVSAGASSHSHQLRPSQARALQSADMVVWVGEELTPWMAEAVSTLAEDARVIGLLQLDGTTVLPFREGAVFGGGDAHDDHAHADEKHDDHAHGDHAHDDQAHEDHGHDHDGRDPHAWLSPENAMVWMGRIAEDLAELDPANASLYRANAAAGRDEIAGIAAEISARLGPLRDARFVVFHDAYQYFETSFGLAAVGAISLGDASDPSPARIAELRAHIAEEEIDCVLAEPQFNPGLVAAVAEGSNARTGILDPLGAGLTPGPMLYTELLRGLAADLGDCLAANG
jgi:zinc transport system substrate-binding protein